MTTGGEKRASSTLVTVQGEPTDGGLVMFSLRNWLVAVLCISTWFDDMPLKKEDRMYRLRQRHGTTVPLINSVAKSCLRLSDWPTVPVLGRKFAPQPAPRLPTDEAPAGG